MEWGAGATPLSAEFWSFKKIALFKEANKKTQKMLPLVKMAKNEGMPVQLKSKPLSCYEGRQICQNKIISSRSVFISSEFFFQVYQ